MKSLQTHFLSISILFLICNGQLSSQNVGIGTNTPTSKLHLQSTIQSNSSLDIDFETGTIEDENTGGDYDWYITSSDGYNSTKCAKIPQIFSANETATLKYGFNMAIGKEVTIAFNIKYDDPSNMVNFSINSSHFNYSPTTNSTWKSFSTTFVSQSSSDVISFGVKANQDEAFPIVHIDNIMITYEDGHVLKIEDGTEGDGLFLQSDALGHTEWFDLRGEFDQKLSDNLQDLDFDTTQNALFIEDGNGVLISSLKNDYGNLLRLSGDEIVGSPSMSLHLPASGSNNPTLHFDANNSTMDWGIVNGSIKGVHSTRWGENNTASNTYATAWGRNNVSSGIRSTTWGHLNVSSEDNSTAWGIGNESSGSASTSFGANNESSGQLSTSWGEENLVSGLRSTSWGFENLATSAQATSWGRNNQATEVNSTSFGIDNLSSGELSTSWGENNDATGLRSTSWGISNIASGSQSTAWCGGNIASGSQSTAWGQNNQAIGSLSTIWGYNNLVQGFRGTAWGASNLVASTAENGIACGSQNSARGKNSFAMGQFNSTETYAEVAIGRFNSSSSGNTANWNEDDMLFTIGNGTSFTNKKNALVVLKNGNIGIARNTPTYDLHLGFDSAAKPGSSSWTVSSDRRLKKDITKFTDGLEIITAIEPIWFTYNGLADIPEGTYVGTIAQDLEEIAPYMVSEYTHRDEDGRSEKYKAVNYGAMDFVLINAIKEQQLEIAELKAQIAEILSLLGSNTSGNSSITED